MSKNISLSEAEKLVDTSNGKFFWETFGKTLVSFRPMREHYASFRRDGHFNRKWSKGKGAWGTIKRYSVNNDGTFTV